MKISSKPGDIVFNLLNFFFKQHSSHEFSVLSVAFMPHALCSQNALKLVGHEHHKQMSLWVSEDLEPRI